MFRSLFCLGIFFSSFAFANYAWLPKYQSLRLKLSGEYYKSTENFAEDGSRVDFYNGTRQSQFSEYEFALQGEYGFAKDWALGWKLPFRNSFVEATDSGTSTNDLSSFGVGDTALSIKWLVIPGDLRLAIESINTIPFYSTGPFASSDLALGDGTFTSGFKFHGGYLLDGKYSFALSPGVLFKFKTYSSQFTLDAAFGVAFKPVYFRLFSDLALSLGAEELSTTTVSNPAYGSGGSFAKLSNSPNLWSLGLLGGLFFYDQYRLELYGMQAITGNRAPYGFKFGVAFATSFDFFEEEKKIKVKELPFDAEPTQDKPN